MYKKHGSDFLWGDAQDTELSERLKNVKFTYGLADTSADGTGTAMSDDKVKEQKAIAKK